MRKNRNQNHTIINHTLLLVNTANVGLDEVHAIVQKDGRVIQSNVKKIGADQSSVTFTPEIAGLYNISVFVGGVDVQGIKFSF